MTFWFPNQVIIKVALLVVTIIVKFDDARNFNWTRIMFQDPGVSSSFLLNKLG